MPAASARSCESRLMELSSGIKSLLAQLMSWSAVAGLAVMIFLNYESLRSLAGVPAVVPSTFSQVSPPPAAPPVVRSGSTVELRADQSGHYRTRASINGRHVPVMVDTGATVVVLTHDDARRAGIFLKPSDYKIPVSTANGTTHVAPVDLDSISIGDITVRNVRAAVAQHGQLAVTLLGMTFLSRLERVDMRSGMMLLKH